jgi:hypothetical protein
MVPYPLGTTDGVLSYNTEHIYMNVLIRKGHKGKEIADAIFSNHRLGGGHQQADQQ